MVSTGNNRIDIKGITVVDDVNSSNKDEICGIIRDCSLYIEGKFPMPMSKMTGTPGRIVSKVEELKNSKKFLNETQYEGFLSKVVFWSQDIFKDIADKVESGNCTDCTVVINNSISKHEFWYVGILAELGVNVLIISKDIEKLDTTGYNINSIKFGTNENLDIDKNFRNNTEAVENNNGVIERKLDMTLQDVEESIYEKGEILKLNIIGTEMYEDTCNVYAKLHEQFEKDNKKFLMIDNGFEKPTYNETQTIPRISTKSPSVEYIIQTLGMFVQADSEQEKENIKNKLKEFTSRPELSTIENSMLYNRLATILLTTNHVLNMINKEKAYIVYYGCIKKNDNYVLELLSVLDRVGLIVLTSDKTKAQTVGGLATVELPNSVEIFPIPLIDKRNGASTMAAEAQKRVDSVLYSGDTLGMYKPGMFRKCKPIMFNTTYDEVKLWWNKDVYIRPNFEVHGDVAITPTMMRIIKGVKDDKASYAKEVQMYCCAKTIVAHNENEVIALSEYMSDTRKVMINHCTDVNGTKFDEQKPFVENNKLVRDRITNGRNYPYSFLSYNKQQFILDAIEGVLTDDKINHRGLSDEAFTEKVLEMGLNLSKQVTQLVQWYEFYGYNPNLVVALASEPSNMLDFTIMLSILQNLGFDILVFVPTGYNTIEEYVTPRFEYTADVIGESSYDVDLTHLHATENIEIKTTEEKAGGLFKKLFGR